jgi:hypothetical protein
LSSSTPARIDQFVQFLREKNTNEIAIDLFAYQIGVWASRRKVWIGFVFLGGAWSSACKKKNSLIVHTD